MSRPVYEKDLTGLLVVDPYNDFISEGGILWPLIKEIAEAVQCVPNMLAVLLAARAIGIRVFFAPHHRDLGSEDEIEGWKYIAPVQKFAHERASSEQEPGAEPFAKNSRRCPAKWLRKNTGAPAVSRTQTSISSLRSMVSTS
jgi:nicotinamidase-related amidase